jgi:hypothetical protein
MCYALNIFMLIFEKQSVLIIYEHLLLYANILTTFITRVL